MVSVRNTRLQPATINPVQTKTMEREADFGVFVKLSKIQGEGFEAYSWHISKGATQLKEGMHI